MVKLLNAMLIFVAAVSLAIGIIALVRKEPTTASVSCPDPIQPDSEDCVSAWKAGAIPYGYRPEQFRNTKEKFSQSQYKKVWGFNDEAGYRKNMMLNNPDALGAPSKGPQGDPATAGGDPTNSLSYYAFGMKDKDNFWEAIPDDYPLVSTTDDGLIKVDIDYEWKDYTDKSKIGAPRHMSKIATLGGILVGDFMHMPVGCAMWPAFWQNGYIGVRDQIFQTDPDLIKKYQDDLPNLAGEWYCDGDIDKDAAGQQIKGASFWPNSGEVDILEQTNFTGNNLTSLHTGQWGIMGPASETGQSAGNIYQQSNGWNGSWGDLGKSEMSWQDWAAGGEWITADRGSKIYAENLLRPQCGNDGCNFDLDGGQWKGCSSYPEDSEWKRCPCAAATNAGTSQTVGRKGTFGATFNNNGGGVCVTVWVPFKSYKFYWFGGNSITRENLKLDGGPLSDNPDPSTWSDNFLHTDWIFPSEEEMAAKSGYPASGMPPRNMGFQYVILNTAVGGDWARGAVPNYCTIDGSKQDGHQWLKDCFYANPEDANSEGIATDPESGKKCYDGGVPSYGSGNFGNPVDTNYDPSNQINNGVNPLRRPVFLTEAYWLVGSMALFLNPETDQLLDTSMPCSDGEVCGLVDPKDW